VSAFTFVRSAGFSHLDDFLPLGREPGRLEATFNLDQSGHDTLVV
jgi:hypothetical protein